jgi:hypothetical protein
MTPQRAKWLTLKLGGGTPLTGEELAQVELALNVLVFQFEGTGDTEDTWRHFRKELDYLFPPHSE